MGYSREKRDEMPLCGAKKKTGERCRALAGQGTDHLGYGPCKHHLGATANHRKAAAIAEAKRRMVGLGPPLEVEPNDALLYLLYATAGHVRYLGEEIADTNLRTFEAQVLTQLYSEERDRLARIAETCIKSGLSERLVQVVEGMADMMAPFITGVLEDLKLTEEQRQRAPEIVSKRLQLLERRGAPTLNGNPVGLVREG